MLYTYYAVLCIVFCAVPVLAELSTTRVSDVRRGATTSVTLRGRFESRGAGGCIRYSATGGGRDHPSH